jgi:hypothetical protein
MTPSEQLIAYLATLAALVITLLGAMIIASLVPSVLGKIEVFALGTVFGGLIGVLRIPSARANPVATTETGDITVPPGEAK